jgi:hypothetical protein
MDELEKDEEQDFDFKTSTVTEDDEDELVEDAIVDPLEEDALPIKAEEEEEDEVFLYPEGEEPDAL